MDRYFDKITYEVFKRDVKEDKSLYDEINLPKRSTINSAGYDIESIEDIIIPVGEAKTIKTGIKAYMQNDEVLYIHSRSSFGYKYNTHLANATGVIDSDYFSNPDNDGHIQIRLINLGDKELIIKKHDRIAQGIFMKYLTVSNEEKINNKRKGGFGSTDKGDKNE